MKKQNSRTKKRGITRDDGIKKNINENQTQILKAALPLTGSWVLGREKLSLLSRDHLLTRRFMTKDIHIVIIISFTFFPDIVYLGFQYTMFYYFFCMMAACDFRVKGSYKGSLRGYYSYCYSIKGLHRSKRSMVRAVLSAIIPSYFRV